jgi:hypothetical protein
MSQLRVSASEIASDLRRTVRKVSPFVEHFARVGYAAKGVIYSLVGLLAVMAALGTGNGDVTGSHGVLHRLFAQPFGQVLLGAVAAGLACYAAWQFIRAIEDPEHEGTDGGGLMKRAGYFISAVVYSMLVVYAIHMLLGYATSGEDESAKSWSATIMSYPAGTLVIAAIGIGIGLYGITQIYNAYRAKLDRLDFSRWSPATREWLCRVCRFGLAARGGVFGIIGAFLVLAAVRANPNEARGISGALDSLRQQPYGPWLLAVVAAGLIAYGLYEFVKARYRQITPPQVTA